MAIPKDITLTNMDKNSSYIDPDRIVQQKQVIRTDLKNIIGDLNNIEVHYKKVADDKDTKEKWSDGMKSLVNKCNKFENRMKNDVDSLESAINDAIQQYTLYYLRAFDPAGTAIDEVKAE